MSGSGNRLWAVAVIVLSLAVGMQAITLVRRAADGSSAPVGTFAPMLANVIPSVVTIRVTGEAYEVVELKPRPKGLDATVAPVLLKTPFKAGGSGVIVDAENGYILTNNHVIENATKIDIGLADGRRLLARLVGRDTGTDLAVVKVDASELPAIRIGDSDAVRVGDVVAAVGNPFGLEGTATVGIVSAIMRTEIGHESFEDYLQIDAQTNPGNSGGALVNLRGELVGINTVVGGARGKGYSIGFAVPINMARVIQAELVKNGRMRRGAPGIVVQDQSEEHGISYGSRVIHGAVVTKVLPATSAEAAGIKPGELVIRAANKPVRSAAEYLTRVSTVPAGSAIPLVLYAEGKERTVVLDVGTIWMEPVGRRVRRLMGSIAGIMVGDILPGNPLYGDQRGAQILEVPASSPAFATGFEVGDVIVGVEEERVRNTDELFRRLEAAGLQYRVDIIRKGFPAWLRISK